MEGSPGLPKVWQPLALVIVTVLLVSKANLGSWHMPNAVVVPSPGEVPTCSSHFMEWSGKGSVRERRVVG